MATGAKSSDNKPTPSGKTPPCHKIRLGTVKAAIWKRDAAEKGALYSATFSRLFVDSHGNWADAASFGRDELLVLAKVADAAHTWICEQQQRDRQGHNPEVPS